MWIYTSPLPVVVVVANAKPLGVLLATMPPRTD